MWDHASTSSVDMSARGRNGGVMRKGSIVRVALGSVPSTYAERRSSHRGSLVLEETAEEERHPRRQRRCQAVAKKKN